VIPAQPRNRATAQPRNRATAQPRRAEGRIIFAADAVPGAVKSSSHTVASFTGLVDAASRTADRFIQTAGSINRTADAANHTAGSFDLMAGRIIRPADASSRTAGRASRANKSFIRTGKSSSHAVFGQKQAKTAKNRPFCPSRHASVLDCGSPLPLWRSRHARKRQRAAALQNLAGKPVSTLNPQPITIHEIRLHPTK
jgi:hypothetical protein